jgi:acetyl esterase/lipase
MIRKVFNASKPPVPRGCTAKDEVIAGVRCEVMTADVAQQGVMLYLHGGGHVACSPSTHRPFTSWFAKQSWRVFVPDYRLAPEHRFPAGLEDCVAVYRGLLDRGVDATQLVVAGDSAGGNLALSLCLSLRNAGLPQPAAIALFSPVTDFTWSGASIEGNSDRCAMFAKEIMPVATELYLGKHDPRDPMASPYYADLKGLPPMIFHAGGDEVLLDDSIRVVEHAKQAGVEVQVKTWPVVPHIWQMLHQWIPEGRESLRLAHAFLHRHLAFRS